MQAHIAIKIKGTVIFPWNLKSNTVGHQQRNNRFNGCKVNIPVPAIGLSILVFFFFLFVGPNHILSRKKKPNVEGKIQYDWLNCQKKKNEEVNLMINFPLQLNLNISLSCLQVYSSAKGWICNQLWVFRTMFWAKWISKYLQPDRLMHVSRKTAACLIRGFSLLQRFTCFVVPGFFLEDRNVLLY